MTTVFVLPFMTTTVGVAITLPSATFAGAGSSLGKISLAPPVQNSTYFLSPDFPMTIGQSGSTVTKVVPATFIGNGGFNATIREVINMTTSQSSLQTDVNGHYIPQYYDNYINNFNPTCGQNNAPFYIPVGMTPKSGSQTIAITPTGPSKLTVPSGAMRALITVESAQCRYWVDGTTPTSASGHLVSDGDVITLDSASQLSGFQIIGVATNATIQVTYF